MESTRNSEKWVRMRRGEGKGDLRVNTVKFLFCCWNLCHGVVTLMSPCWSPWRSHSHLASALFHYTSCAVLTGSRGEDNAPVPPQALRSPQRGTQTCWSSAKAPANTEPPPTPSPAVGPIPGHPFKLMGPASGPRIPGFLGGNFI